MPYYQNSAGRSVQDRKGYMGGTKSNGIGASSKEEISDIAGMQAELWESEVERMRDDKDDNNMRKK